MNKVAVYGTLMRGEGNHSVMERAQGKFIGDTIINGFDMYHLGGFPGCIPGAGTIECEVYEVENMSVLDRLEGYYEHMPERGLYNRMVVPTDLGDCWIYIYNGKPNTPIKSGSWRDR